MFAAPSGKTYCRVARPACLDGLSTTFRVPGRFLSTLSTAFPRSVRIAGHGNHEPGDMVKGRAQHRLGSAGRSDRLGRRRPGRRPSRQAWVGPGPQGPDAAGKTAETTKRPKEPPIPQPPTQCKHRVVTFVFVAPSGKNYVTGSQPGCLARLSTTFEVRGQFWSTLSTDFPRRPSSGRSVRLDLERPGRRIGEDRQPVGIDLVVREAVRRDRRRLRPE